MRAVVFTGTHPQRFISHADLGWLQEDGSVIPPVGRGVTKVVVKLFAFSDGQVQSAVALHPRLTDPSNFFEVLGVFTFDADKAKVRGALKMK